jgi:hypothetical protein
MKPSLEKVGEREQTARPLLRPLARLRARWKSRIVNLRGPDILRVSLWIVLVWLLLSALPIAPYPIRTGMDASWYYAINMAHAKGIPFGSHLMFTVGPLGYLATPDPDYTAAGPAMAFRIFTYLCLVYGVLRVLRWSGLPAATVAAVVFVTQTLLPQHFPDAWSAAYLSLCLAAMASGGRSLLDLAVVSAAAGFTLLFKVNEGFMAYAVFGSIWIYSSYSMREKWKPLIAIAVLPFAILLAGMQMLSGDAFAAFAYLRNGLDTMSGFSLSASYPGPRWQSSLSIIYLIVIFSIPLVFRARSTITLPSLLPALLVAFAAFKHGMVRQDSHADMVQVKIAIAVLFLIVACRRLPERFALVLLALFGAGYTVAIVAKNQVWIPPIAKHRLSPAGMADSIRMMTSSSGPWDLLRQQIRAALEPLKLDASFHEIVGRSTVDAFPENIDVIRANGWSYQPRPGIQSSASFTPRIDGINARYLEEGRGSEFALFVWYAIDNRHPFLQDPQTLLALLNRYDPVHSDKKALLLKRSPQANLSTAEKIGEVSTPWYGKVDFPETRPGELILARFHIESSVFGRLRSFLFRSTPVIAHIGYKSGRNVFHFVVPGNLGAGAIVSSFPESIEEFAAFLKNRTDPDPPAWIIWNCENLIEYRSPIRIEWYRLHWQN